MIEGQELEKDEIVKAQRVLGANNEYLLQANEYGSKDALFALILFIIEVLGLSLVGKLFLHKGDALTEIYIVSVTGIFSMIFIGLVFLFCIIRRQKLVTIGFSKTQAKKSFILGILLFGFVAILCSIRAIFSGSIIQTDINLIIIRIIYYLIFISFMEELIFRAYIGTRFFGFFKNKKLSIAIVGIMFSLEHIPFYMIISQVSLAAYISSHFFNFISLAIIHILFQWLYAKYNSIIAPTILHFIWDYIQWFIIL
jgi:membrane protease YdiL (CAAX protease family)